MKQMIKLHSLQFPLPKILGLDIGTKNVGVACSDEKHRLAFPLHTLKRKPPRNSIQSIQSFSKTLQAVVNDNTVCAIVVGLPINEDGGLSVLCNEIIELMRRVEVCNERNEELCCTFWNERNTTVDSNLVFQRMSGNISKQRKHKDMVAASLILGGYLDRINEED